MAADPDIQTHATTLLTSLGRDGSGDCAELSALLYDELRALARSMMGHERANHTLEPTALVNEAYLRLINSEGLGVESKDHFFMLAAKVMRQILIDHARGVNRLKRGGGRERVPLTIACPKADTRIDASDLLAIDEALEALRSLDERKARLVELRFFGGLDEETAARILGVARSTASSDWRFARAWLLARLGEDTLRSTHA